MEDASTAKTIQMESTARDAKFIITGNFQMRLVNHVIATPLVQNDHNVMLTASVHANRGCMVRNVINADPDILDSPNLVASKLFNFIVVLLLRVYLPPSYARIPARFTHSLFTHFAHFSVTRGTWESVGEIYLVDQIELQLFENF